MNYIPPVAIRSVEAKPYIPPFVSIGSEKTVPPAILNFSANSATSSL